jgi:hypothetical protein
VLGFTVKLWRHGVTVTALVIVQPLIVIVSIKCDIVLFFISFFLNPENKKVEENLSEKVLGISDRNIGNFE